MGFGVLTSSLGLGVRESGRQELADWHQGSFRGNQPIFVGTDAKYLPLPIDIGSRNSNGNTVPTSTNTYTLANANSATVLRVRQARRKVTSENDDHNNIVKSMLSSSVMTMNRHGSTIYAGCA